MENLFSVVPFGGLAMLMIALYRLAAIALRFRSKNYLIDLIQFLWAKISLFLQQEYRLLTVFILSVCTYIAFNIFLAGVSLPWYLPILTGVVTTITTLFLTAWLRNKFSLQDTTPSHFAKFLMLMNEGRRLSNGWGLLCYFSGVMFLLWQFPVTHGLDLIFLSAGFGIGGTGMIIFAVLTDAEAFAKQTFSASTQLVKTENFDTLLTALAGVVFFSATFTKNPITLAFPVMLAFGGVLVSAISKVLREKSIHFYSHRTISALLLVVLAIVLIYGLLPDYRVIRNRELSKTDIFFSVCSGILVSWFSGEMFSFHEWTLKIYNRFVRNKFLKINILHQVMEFLMKSFTSLGLVGVLVSGLGFAYLCAGLYGMLVALVAMFSLINAKSYPIGKEQELVF